MNKNYAIPKGLCLILPLAVFLGGCAAKETSTEPITESAGEIVGAPFDFSVVPESFSLSINHLDVSLPVTVGSQKRTVADYQKDGSAVSWRYPEEQVAVSVAPAGDYLSVSITSEKDGDNVFTWPEISGETYYLPLGEGKRIPADDPAWQEYLAGQEFSVLEHLSMPFWMTAAGDYSVLFIMEDPHRSQLNFASSPEIGFSVSHTFADISESRTNRYRIYLTDENPVEGAKIYRNYAKENGTFLSLEDKAAGNPDIRKLYGAPFIYLWGDFAIAADDINWPAFRNSLSTPMMNHLASFMGLQESGHEFETVLNEIKTQDYVNEYQKNIICNYISQVLMRDDFFNPDIVLQSSPELDSLLDTGYENLNASEKIQVHKYSLAANLPQVFADAGEWMDTSTSGFIRELKASGIERAWIGLNSWEQAYAKPELVEEAADQDYLIASYDSYHSIHEPGKEQWITAQFEDLSLFEDASVSDKDGNKIKGFQNVGRKLNPALSFPAVKARMEGIMANQLPFNSWFIDCDATGEIYDDYTPSHITSQEKDLAARLERMAYIRDHYNLVIGSEGGHDFAASTIAFAHGIELKSFSWMDDDMKKNKDSEYYIGKYFSPTGGVAEHFSKRIPVKDKYYRIFVDPAYDIPLFKLVYNDSVITGYHWDWSTFKIQGATKERMVREVLYNVPPLYHLDAVEWKKYKDDIISHQAVWSEFSEKAVTREMTDFQYLSEDGQVQKTVFGADMVAVANFGDVVYQYEDMDIPAQSVLIEMEGERMVYTPAVQDENV